MALITKILKNDVKTLDEDNVGREVKDKMDVERTE